MILEGTEIDRSFCKQVLFSRRIRRIRRITRIEIVVEVKPTNIPSVGLEMRGQIPSVQSTIGNDEALDDIHSQSLSHFTQSICSSLSPYCKLDSNSQNEVTQQEKAKYSTYRSRRTEP